VERIQITELVDIDPPESFLIQGLNVQATAAVVVTWCHYFREKWLAMEFLQLPIEHPS
jgi:hypothetical protein